MVTFRTCEKSWSPRKIFINSYILLLSTYKNHLTKQMWSKKGTLPNHLWYHFCCDILGDQGNPLRNHQMIWESLLTAHTFHCSLNKAIAKTNKEFQKQIIDWEDGKFHWDLEVLSFLGHPELTTNQKNTVGLPQVLVVHHFQEIPEGPCQHFITYPNALKPNYSLPSFNCLNVLTQATLWK